VIFSGRAIQLLPIGDHTKEDIRHLAFLGEPEVLQPGLVEGQWQIVPPTARQLTQTPRVLWLKASAELIGSSVAAKINGARR